MKRLFFTILSVFLLTITATAQKTYAIITGVSNYEGSENDLTQSTKDAKTWLRSISLREPRLCC